MICFLSRFFPEKVSWLSIEEISLFIFDFVIFKKVWIFIEVVRRQICNFVHRKCRFFVVGVIVRKNRCCLGWLFLGYVFV